jgi:predicted nuclease of predicted toxin-antitoxin system
MKLLFDHNLSPKLAAKLADLFPGSDHVYPLGLDHADDLTIWKFAKDNGYSIVSKDADYNSLSVLWGFPPKVIWVLSGNCTTAEIETLFRTRVGEVRSFGDHAEVGTLALR